MSKSECVASAADYSKCSTVKGTWLDASLTIDERLDKLSAIVNTSEQIMQLQNGAPSILDAGIPQFQWLNDDEHGLRNADGTIFPSMCTNGPSWNVSLFEQIGLATATEARGIHNGLTSAGVRGVNPSINAIGITGYTPMINLAWNPFWGRNQESAGEDPILSGRLAHKYVDGWQANVTGTGGTGQYVLGLACAKHYAVNNVESIPASRTNYSVLLEARTTWEYHFRAFLETVPRAKVAHIMASYNSITNTNISSPAIPTAADPGLLDGMLRGLWKWDGWVVSDYDAWRNIYTTHGYCGSFECAAATGLNAGMDQEGGGDQAITALPQALADKLVTVERINTSFRRLFRARLRLGLHDPPIANPANLIKNDTTVLQSPEHLALARSAAVQGGVLLQNNAGTLPLKAADFANGSKRLALVGFQAFDAASILGNYDVLPRNPPGVATIALGINETIGGANVLAAQGCADVTCSTTDGFAAAVAAARQADVVVYTAGLYYLNTAIPNDPRVEREGHDRSDLSLYPGALSLLGQLRAAAGTKPVVVVLIHGGAVLVEPVLSTADAVLDMHYPGQEGGRAAADLLFGAASPAGRLTTTYYSSNDAVTWPGVSSTAYDFYSGKGATYRYLQDAGPGEGAVTLPFGFGLSYTTFNYSAVAVASPSVAACDPINVTVHVHNTGGVDSDEVVQLYVTAFGSASNPTPRLTLADFARVHIPAGQSLQVELQALPEHRMTVEQSFDIYKPVITVFPGTVELFVGGGQPQWFTGGLSATVEATGMAPLSACSADFPPHP